ncbi:MAG: 4-(cytidine 5'-diphospho)-2-C-methyl-D-erythritol kinase [Micrococcales bacterium]|nr:4-(cytidine 5'-diphospho)-2-C-methyl-D-erythritol kinase [Micrococcales bacterium]
MSSAMVTPAATTVRVPAKVNLELLVGPARADGFHSLSTVYQAVSLFDDVTVESADDWSVVVRGAQASFVPADATNLALRGARALADAAGVQTPVAITIDKEIPVAGGMAGGSADAAAALVACDHHWGLRTRREELEELAAELGSDVPFLIAGGTAMGSGRGELIAPVLARGAFNWVFALAREGLSTPSVFRELDRLRGDAEVLEPVPSPELMSALRSGDAHSLAAVLANDLQEAAFSLRPELRECLDAGMAFGALGGIVSGSGPTIAFLVADREAALDLAVSLTASGAAADVRRASGPVQGAQVVTGPRALG